MIQYIETFITNGGDILYVVGLVGPFGSGCTYVAKKIQENYGFKYISLSDLLREHRKNEFPYEDIEIIYQRIRREVVKRLYPQNSLL